MIYFARKHDCEACALKPKCCPNAPARKIARSIHEAARDKARAIAKAREPTAVSVAKRKKVEMLLRSSEAHSQARSILAPPNGPQRSQGRVPIGRPAQNLRKLAAPCRPGLRHIRRTSSTGPPSSSSQPLPPLSAQGVLQRNSQTPAIPRPRDFSREVLGAYSLRAMLAASVRSLPAPRR